MTKIKETKADPIAKLSLEYYPESFKPQKTYSNEEADVYYRPFLYGAETGFRRWKREFYIGKGLFKIKWFKWLFN